MVSNSADGAAPIPWHHLSPAQALERLAVGPGGLSGAEAERRLGQTGPNRLPEARRRGSLERFLAQFRNLLIYILLVAALVTAILRHWIDSGVILGVVLVNAIIGFLQEGKAEDALEAIRAMLSPTALVWRDGRLVTLDAAALVPGDLVQLQPGDRVPADLRLTRAKGLQVDESALTGESVPVEKATGALPLETPLADRRTMVYSGTLVTQGQGTGVVVATGAATEIGRLSALVAGMEPLTTPLLRQMSQFARWLTTAILALASLTFGFGVWLRGYSADEMFLASVGLAVAAIPEGLPAIMTITLAIGVQRMARRNAIIRRLPAVETLGSVAVICTDKTGTLTRNEMTVTTVATPRVQVRVTGSGYDPHGSFERDGRSFAIQEDPVLMAALRAAALCSDTTLEQRDGVWRVHGDPMEGALLIAALKAGIDPEAESLRFPRSDLIPFDAGYRFMATLHHDHHGGASLFLKGAPEEVMVRCDGQMGPAGKEPLDLPAWHALVEELAQQGQRVLAVATRPGHPQVLELSFSDLGRDLTLLALLGLMDPPRPEALAAVQRCREAGIRVKMITGDHQTTARAIGALVGLQGRGATLSGQELDALDDGALDRLLPEVDVYARVTPEHKLRLVERLQAQGLVVVMTGDGVNDAPALKRADVGVAMGIKGTEAAKEAAEMVLADDNFVSITHAVEEGRTVYDNLKKAILFILPTNGGEALVMLGAVALGFRQLPLTPVQILWVNMITAVTLALALAFEPPEAGVMRRPPRDPREPLLSPLLLWRIGFVSLILMAGTFGVFLWDLERGLGIEHARTAAVNTLVAFEIFYLFNSRYITAPILNRQGLLGSPSVLAAVALLILFQLAYTYLGPLQSLFGSASIDAIAWVRVVLVASTVLILVELEKLVIRRRTRAPGKPGLA